MKVRVEIGKKYAPLALPDRFSPTKTVEPTPLNQLDQVIEDNSGFLDRLEQRRQTRIQAYEEWFQGAQSRATEERRRVMPGYVDGSMLQPMLPESQTPANGKSSSQASPPVAFQPPSADLEGLTL